MSNKVIIKQVQSIKKRRANAVTFEDQEARMLTAMGLGGLHLKVIAEVSGMSVGMAAYRLKKLGLSVRDYRSGRSSVTPRVIQALMPATATMLDAYIDETEGFRKEAKKPFMAVAAKQPLKLLKTVVQEMPGYGGKNNAAALELKP